MLRRRYIEYSIGLVVLLVIFMGGWWVLSERGGKPDEPTFWGLTAKEYGALAREKQQAILSSICVQSCGIFFNVPIEGVSESRADFEQVIRWRRWLEGTDDVAARFVALILQNAVDAVIVEELARREYKAALDEFARIENQDVDVSSEIGVPVKVNSFDKALIEELLQGNEIDKIASLEYALSLDTWIADFCREQRYRANDFLNGKVLKAHASEDLLFHIGAEVAPGESSLPQEAPIYSLFPINVMMIRIVGRQEFIDTKKKLSEFIIPMVLRAIDFASESRIAAEVYFEHGSFGKMEESEHPDKTWYESAKSRLLAGLKSDAFAGYITPLHPDIEGNAGFLAKRLLKSSKRLSPKLGTTSVNANIAWLLSPFMVKADVVKHGEKYGLPTFLSRMATGHWSNLPD